MGFLTPYIYVSKKSGQKFWVHAKPRGKMILYYFSKDPSGSLNSLPGGREVVENPVTGMPFLKKKGGGLFGGLLGGKPKEKKQESEKNQEKSQETQPSGP
jgi:hypothetical protein